MNKKNKIILIIVAIAVILIAIIFIWVKTNKREFESQTTRNEEFATDVADVNKSEAVLLVQAESVLEAEVARGEVSPEILEEERIKNLAKAFVERWGSYSTDGDYSNFESLKSQATEEMGKVIDEEIARLKVKPIPNPLSAQAGPLKGEGTALDSSLKGDVTTPSFEGVRGMFYGITTKALSAEIENKSLNKASVKVSYQKQETVIQHTPLRRQASPSQEGNNEEFSVSYGEIVLEMEKEGNGQYLVASIEY